MSLVSDFYTDWQVVVNEEEQFSIWPTDKEMPLGWRFAEVSGTKEECLKHIDNTWTDMRPLTLRKQMEVTRKAS